MCWGRNDYGQTDSLGGAFAALVTVHIHTCGLRGDDDEAVCWGQLSYSRALYVRFRPAKSRCVRGLWAWALDLGSCL